MSLFDELTANGNSVAWLAEKLGDFLEPEVSQNLSEIIDSVRATKASELDVYKRQEQDFRYLLEFLQQV